MVQNLALTFSRVFFDIKFVRLGQVDEVWQRSKEILFDKSFFRTLTNLNPLNKFYKSCVKMVILIWVFPYFTLN